ncbi:suppressor protein SRP40-like [Xiphophorus couchianus]|uniref:suppressor protein SRP40-like n=1 Tax=Xiphophorus couchianus TaxID=32473 RepID=UPI001016DFE3|nr:suppressor protein SRP40-like [Xiphophorus couchianus]
MALPADGSPKLEGLPDNGKEHGKVWSNETDMVSEDYGKGLRCSSPPQSVDCATSSSGSSAISYSGSSTTTSSEDEVGNACTISSSGSSTTSSSGSSTTSSSGSSTTSSSEDEANNEDQDDFNSRLRVVQVLAPNIKFLWGIGVLEQSLKLLNSKLDQLNSAVDRGSAASLRSEILEILPPNFKYIKDIGVAEKPEEDTAPSTSLEFTSGLDKQEEPILRPENSRPIGTSQHHQVGLEEDGASLTSGRARSIIQKVDAAKEDNPPLKLSSGTVLPSSFDKPEEPILRPEDSIPISASPQPLAGWRNLVTFCRAIRIPKKVVDAKEDDTPSKPSDRVGSKEDVTHATSVTGINGKRTKDSDAEEQPPGKRTRDTVAKEEPPAKRSKDTLAEKELPAKKTRDSVTEVKLPAKRTRNSDDARQEPSAKKTRENQTEDVLPSKRTRDSVAEEEPPAKRTRDTVAEEELPAKTAQ